MLSVLITAYMNVGYASETKKIVEIKSLTNEQKVESSQDTINKANTAQYKPDMATITSNLEKLKTTILTNKIKIVTDNANKCATIEDCEKAEVSVEYLIDELNQAEESKYEGKTSDLNCHKVLKAIFANPNINDDIILDIVNNEHFTPDMLKELLEENKEVSEYVIRCIVENENTSKLLTKDVLLLAAKHKNTSTYVLRLIAEHENSDVEVLKAILVNPRIAFFDTSTNEGSDSWNVVCAVMKNKNVTQDMLKDLLEDPNTNYDIIYGILVFENTSRLLTKDLLLLAVNHKNTRAGFLEVITNHKNCDDEVQQAVLARKSQIESRNTTLGV